MTAELKAIRALAFGALLLVVLGASAAGANPALLFLLLVIGVCVLLPNRNGG